MFVLKDVFYRGATTLVDRRDAPLRFEKLTLLGTHFCGKSDPEWDWNFLLFSKFPTFFPNFQKMYPTEGLIFIFWYFCDPTWDSWKWKKYPDQRIIPVPLFAQVTHRGFFIDLILCNASIRTRKIGFTLTNLCCIIFILGYWRDITKLCFPINCCR